MDGLTKAHVVAQDASFALQVELVEPSDANLLVLKQVLVDVTRQTEALREVESALLLVDAEPLRLLVGRWLQRVVDVSAAIRTGSNADN